MRVPFFKYEGIKNDFVVVEDLDKKIKKGVGYSNLAKQTCARKTGIGADGLVIVRKSDDYDIKFRFYNFDGSESDMCGNAIRCFTHFVYFKMGQGKDTRKKTFAIDTKGGIMKTKIISNNLVQVNLGKPRIRNKLTTIKISKNREFKCTIMDMGIPHCVVHLEKDYDDAEFAEMGRLIEESFLPGRMNVMFSKIINENTVQLPFIWERGVGETFGCGTGSCATAVACILNKKVSQREVFIKQKGGTLKIEWNAKDNCVYKTGPCNSIYEGVFKSP